MNGKKILIVDFDEKSVDPLSSYLDGAGYEILVAKDGEEGLEMCKAEHPDLVILEPMLPKLHGFELCSIITKDMDPKIPVIILTKFYKEQQFKIESTRSFGASAFLSKPFDKKELQSHLSDLISGSGEKEEEEMEETEIPNSFSAESLQDLEENMAREDVAVHKNREPEFDILEVTPKEEPQAPSPVNSGSISQEIDDMLKATLSDFGLGKSEAKPSPVVGAPKKEEPDSVFEAKVSSALEELKSEVKIEEKFAAATEEPTPLEVEGKEPAREREATPRLGEELTRGFEDNVAASTSEPQTKKEDVFIREDAKPLNEGPKEAVEDEVLEEPQADVAQSKEAVGEPKEESKETVETQEEIKAEPKKKKEPLLIRTDETGFFDDYGALEEEPSFFHKILAKIKSTPTKLLIPITAAPVMIIIAAVLFLQPRAADKKSVQQVSLGVPTVQEKVEDPLVKEELDPADTERGGSSASEDGVDEMTGDDSVEAKMEEVQEPAEKPQPKRQSSAPPFQPLTAEGGATAIDPQVLGAVAAPRSEDTSSDDSPPVKTSSEGSDPPAEEQPAFPPANQVQTGDLVSIQQVDEEPIVLKRVLPEYPAAARNMRITGTILVSALIDERGNVIKTAVIRGVKGPFGFNEASEEAVKQWRFKPATKDGVNVKVWKQIPISFQKEN